MKSIQIVQPFAVDKIKNFDTPEEETVSLVVLGTSVWEDADGTEFGFVCANTKTQEITIEDYWNLKYVGLIHQPPDVI